MYCYDVVKHHMFKGLGIPEALRILRMLMSSLPVDEKFFKFFLWYTNCIAQTVPN